MGFAKDQNKAWRSENGRTKFADTYEPDEELRCVRAVWFLGDGLVEKFTIPGLIPDDVNERGEIEIKNVPNPRGKKKKNKKDKNTICEDIPGEYTVVRAENLPDLFLEVKFELQAKRSPIIRININRPQATQKQERKQQIGCDTINDISQKDEHFAAMEEVARHLMHNKGNEETQLWEKRFGDTKALRAKILSLKSDVFSQLVDGTAANGPAESAAAAPATEDANAAAAAAADVDPVPAESAVAAPATEAANTTAAVAAPATEAAPKAGNLAGAKVRLDSAAPAAAAPAEEALAAETAARADAAPAKEAPAAETAAAPAAKAASGSVAHDPGATPAPATAAAPPEQKTQVVGAEPQLAPAAFKKKLRSLQENIETGKPSNSAAGVSSTSSKDHRMYVSDHRHLYI